MTTILFIDDVRDPPDWWRVFSDCEIVVARTSQEAMEILLTRNVDEISFDHDLGGDDTTMPIAKYIEEAAHAGRGKQITWSIHSANPVGRANLEAALQSADKFWSKRRGW